jgi:putative RNA 2'-phosphotransferase
MDKRHTRISKFLSYVLRHRPDEIGVQLDAQGWISIEELLAACTLRGRPITRDDLDYVVANNNKSRFALSEDGLRIRASQGHSVEIDLGYETAAPPEVLYHGTATRFMESIRRSGLIKGNRHHVHLSAEAATAREVGRRHGAPVVLRVRAGEMARAGVEFFVSANGVWLTDSVPYSYIDETDAPEARDLLTAVYAAFNARDVDVVLAAMHAEVAWPNGWEGGYLSGLEAVRDYWARQWAALDPRVEPMGFETEKDGRTAVTVHSVVRDLDGNVIFDGTVEHVYTIEGGLIRHMEIRER